MCVHVSLPAVCSNIWDKVNAAMKSSIMGGKPAHSSKTTVTNGRVQFCPYACGCLYRSSPICGCLIFLSGGGEGSIASWTDLCVGRIAL